MFAAINPFLLKRTAAIKRLGIMRGQGRIFRSIWGWVMDGGRFRGRRINSSGGRGFWRADLAPRRQSSALPPEPPGRRATRALCIPLGQDYAADVVAREEAGSPCHRGYPRRATVF